MLWLLVLLAPRLVYSTLAQNHLHLDYDQMDSAVAMKTQTQPQIYYCRSPNMEVFTCWWHPLDNSSESDDNVTYSLTYTVEKGPKRECPDYVTGGPNSCHFDSSHTSIWTMYCMNVAARTSHGVFKSKEHCLDVADIEPASPCLCDINSPSFQPSSLELPEGQILSHQSDSCPPYLSIMETEAPVNLTYTLMNSTDEAGRSALVTWVYPNPTHIQYGWITLVFQLQYWRITEPNNWKVKGLLRESQLELLDLPVGEYIVRVRCRSRNQGIWSKWSAPLLLTIPGRSITGKLLTHLPVTISVTAVGVLVVLVIGFGIIPQGKRIKTFLLPPIPKPHIRGIDPKLLKKGSLDVINHHFLSFHGYKPPSYSEEVWDSVSMDGNQPLQRPQNVPSVRTNEYSLGVPASPVHSQPLVQTSSCLGHYTPVLIPYCQAPAENFPTACAWPRANPTQPALLAFPGTDYSMMVEPEQQTAPPSSSQDFYTCVNMLGEGGEVHLVPCLPSHGKQRPYVQLKEEGDGGLEKYMANKMEAVANGKAAVEIKVESEGAEQCDAAVPLLSETTGTQGRRV